MTRLRLTAEAAGLLAGLAASVLLLSTPPAAAQGSGDAVVYVDADAAPGGDGASWATAFCDLQDALAAAEAGDEVWVAEGVYKPTEGSDREATFVLMSGVALYGGFDGTETSLGERDWTLHRSILSGDIGVLGDSLDNAYHVVTAADTDSTAVLDGFTVQHGRATVVPNHQGAGVYAPHSAVTIRHCLIRWNGANEGSGIFSEGGAPLIEDCLFMGNLSEAVYDAGGAPTLRRVVIRDQCCRGLQFEGGSHALIEDALVEGTRPFAPGGESLAAYVVGSSPRFVRTTFRDNDFPGGEGAGAYVTDFAAPVFEDCLFEGNDAVSGGAVLIDGGAAPLFLRTTFRDNTAGTGGAVEAKLATPAFLFCRFEGNRASHSGGAVDALGSGVTVIGGAFVGNVSAAGNRVGGALLFTGGPWQGRPTLVASTLFAGNEAGGNGGAVAAFFVDEGEARLVNVTFAGNRARYGAGGAVYAEGSGGLRIENAVLWGDEAPSAPGTEEVYVTGEAGPTVARSLVMGGCPSGVTCEGVTGADPLFVRVPDAGPDGRWGTEDDDYGDLRLQEGSPAEDHGLTALLPADVWDLDGDGDTSEPLPVDVAGQPRVVGASVDAGAYEGAVPVAMEPGPEAEAVGVEVWPNPARDAATVVLVLPEAGEVEVALYDVLGRRVAVLATGFLPAGRHEVPLASSPLPPGVYVVRVTAGDLSATARLTLVR